MINKHIKRWQNFAIISAVMLTLSGCSLHATTEENPQDLTKKRPNIVWLVTEDNSKHYLKLYDSNGAHMPTIESLATNGITFENAFSNSPVCSTARTTLATGVYGTSIGTMNHRGYQSAALPSDLKPFSQLLKEAGYYTTNNVKTDYNFDSPEELWSVSSNKADWRGRAADQPFFHMQTFGITHEGKLHFGASAIKNAPTKHNPEKVKVAPIYPDTETFRYTYAKTLDNHVKADNIMANIVKKLEQDGELENTFIFYFGDHGGVLPGSKGYLFETGLSVPLVVRIPDNFKHLVGKGLTSNTRVDGIVSFIDFAPTVLELAGIEAPKRYDGKSFFSPQLSLEELNKRDEVYAQADRFDEKSDLVRSVRKGNFKYIRHYQPYYPDALDNYYRYKQLAFQEWRQLHQDGKLSPIQSAFFETKQPEALYDVSRDPYETVNLANQPQYKDKLIELRKLLQQNQRANPDLGFIAESTLVQEVSDHNFSEYAQNNHDRILALIEIADLQLQPWDKAKERLTALLDSQDQDVLYRALIVATSFGKKANTFEPAVRAILDEQNSVQVKSRAMEFLALVSDINPNLLFKQLYQAAQHDLEKVELLNIATLLKEQKDITFDKPVDVKIVKPVRGEENFKINTWLYNRWSYITKAE